MSMLTFDTKLRRFENLSENRYGLKSFSDLGLFSSDKARQGAANGQDSWGFFRGALHRARSLRNLLVSGNECGRVFPAGVGPGSPSRDAANWLPSRFSLSVETRRRYGWLRMMVFPGARLFPSPNLVPFGRVAARERQGALSRRVW